MNRNRRPPARRAYYLEPPPVQFRKLHGQGQPQSCAFEPAGKAVIDLPEELQRPADLIAGHSYTRVSNPKAQAISIGFGLRADLNLAPWRRKLDRVRKQIDKDPLQLGFVSINRGA